MVKCFCDKCKKEVPRVTRVLEEQWAKDGHGAKLIPFIVAAHDLCDKCNERFKRLDLDIAEYMKLSEEEIDFLEFTFKVGDEVVTSTGKVGIITDICTCDRCKERGFYEPVVETKVGNGTIYITDNDKRVGFRSFYKIGNRVFGNLDEDVVLDDIERNEGQSNQLLHEMCELRKQYHIIKHYKNNSNGGDNV